MAPRPPRFLIGLTLGFVSMAVVGCHGGAAVPVGWTPQPLAVDPPGVGAREEAGRVQVIICYGAVVSNHAAVRVVCPTQGALFWDPGGYYLTKDPQADRRASVIFRPVVTVTDYWRWRREKLGEGLMVVFEFDVEGEAAGRLHDALAGAEGLVTQRAGGECGLAVSAFLRDFMGQRVAVTRSYFWPHDLAAALWKTEPDRVHVFEAGEGGRTYVAAEEAAAASDAPFCRGGSDPERSAGGSG